MPVPQEMKEPGVSLAMLLPAMLTATKSFVEGGVPRAPAVRNYFKQMLDIYESASPEARAMLDKVGGATMDGFNAWASNGMIQRGAKAVEWAGMVRGLPLLQGGRRELDLPEIAQAKSAVFERDAKAMAERAGVDYEDWKQMSVMDRRQAAQDKGREEGLKKFGIPQFADFLLDTAGYIPGMGVAAKVARRFAAVPGMKGYKPRQSLGDKFKDFAKEDLPGIAFDIAKSYIAPKIPGIGNLPGMGRGRRRGRGLPVAKPEKQWQDMSVEERQAIPFQKVAKQQSDALKKREAEFRAENEWFQKRATNPGAIVWDTISGSPSAISATIANPKNNKEMVKDIDKLAGLQNWQYEQMAADYETSQLGAQQRENPNLKFGTREQKQDLELRQRKAADKKQMETLVKDRQKTLSDAMAREQAFAQQRNKTKGKGRGSAAPSAGFLRKVLGKYKKMRGGMITDFTAFHPPAARNLAAIAAAPAPGAYLPPNVRNLYLPPPPPVEEDKRPPLERAFGIKPILDYVEYGAQMARERGLEPTTDMVARLRAEEEAGKERARLLIEAQEKAERDEDERAIEQVAYELFGKAEDEAKIANAWRKMPGNSRFWQNRITGAIIPVYSREAEREGLEEEQAEGFYTKRELAQREKARRG
jgi:hypothetical protein